MLINYYQETDKKQRDGMLNKMPYMVMQWIEQVIPGLGSLMNTADTIEIQDPGADCKAMQNQRGIWKSLNVALTCMYQNYDSFKSLNILCTKKNPTKSTD